MMGIEEKINNFLVEEFEVDPARISPSADLKEILELDSLDYIDLVVDLVTFQDFYDYITSRLNSKEPV